MAELTPEQHQAQSAFDRTPSLDRQSAPSTRPYPQPNLPRSTRCMQPTFLDLGLGQEKEPRSGEQHAAWPSAALAADCQSCNAAGHLLQDVLSSCWEEQHMAPMPQPDGTSCSSSGSGSYCGNLPSCSCSSSPRSGGSLRRPASGRGPAASFLAGAWEHHTRALPPSAAYQLQHAALLLLAQHYELLADRASMLESCMQRTQWAEAQAQLEAEELAARLTESQMALARMEQAVQELVQENQRLRRCLGGEAAAAGAGAEEEERQQQQQQEQHHCRHCHHYQQHLHQGHDLDSQASPHHSASPGHPEPDWGEACTPWPLLSTTRQTLPTPPLSPRSSPSLCGLAAEPLERRPYGWGSPKPAGPAIGSVEGPFAQLLLDGWAALEGQEGSRWQDSPRPMAVPGPETGHLSEPSRGVPLAPPADAEHWGIAGQQACPAACCTAERSGAPEDGQALDVQGLAASAEEAAAAERVGPHNPQPTGRTAAITTAAPGVQGSASSGPDGEGNAEDVSQLEQLSDCLLQIRQRLQGLQCRLQTSV